MIEKFLKELQTEMELDDPFPKDGPGTWSIILSDDLKVSITELVPEGFDLRCNIGNYPTKNEGELLDKMLISNLFGQGTEGAVLAVDEDSKKLVLVRDVQRSINYQEFKEILEDFLNAADIWHEEVQKQQDIT
jgi:hypothetical protein